MIEGIPNAQQHFVGPEVLAGAALINRDIAHGGEDGFVCQLQVPGLADNVTKTGFHTGGHAHNAPPAAVKANDVVERFVAHIA